MQSNQSYAFVSCTDTLWQRPADFDHARKQSYLSPPPRLDHSRLLQSSRWDYCNSHLVPEASESRTIQVQKQD